MLRMPRAIKKLLRPVDWAVTHSQKTVIAMMADTGGDAGGGGRDARMDSTLQTNENGETEQVKVRRESLLNPVAVDFSPSAFSNVSEFMSARPNVQIAPRLQSIDETPISPTTRFEAGRIPRRLSRQAPTPPDPLFEVDFTTSGTVSQWIPMPRPPSAPAVMVDVENHQISPMPNYNQRVHGSQRTASLPPPAIPDFTIEVQTDESHPVLLVTNEQPIQDIVQEISFQPPATPYIAPEFGFDESYPVPPMSSDQLVQGVQQQLLALPTTPYLVPFAQTNEQYVQGPQLYPPYQPPAEPVIAPYAYDSPWRDAAFSPLPAPALVRPPRPARFIIGPSESTSTTTDSERHTLEWQLSQIHVEAERRREDDRLIGLQMGFIDISTADPSPGPPEVAFEDDDPGRTPTPVIVDGRTPDQQYDNPLPDLEWTPAPGGDPSGATAQTAGPPSQQERDLLLSPSWMPIERRFWQPHDDFCWLTSEPGRRDQTLPQIVPLPRSGPSSPLPVVNQPEPEPEDQPYPEPFEPLPILIRGLLNPRQDPAPPRTAERARRRDEHRRPVFNLDPIAGSEEVVASSPERPSSRTRRRYRRWRRQERGESSRESDRSR